MIFSVFAYSRQGCRTAKKIEDLLKAQQATCYTMEKFLKPGFSPIEKPSRDFYGRCFSDSDALIFVGSCGIAVRMIAPFVKDKKTDPAVLCVDELGKFVIPLLSGHIGGANALTEKLAEGLGAVPVVTTATDINGKFSVDAWAARNGFSISSMKTAKAVSARILERPVPLYSRFPVAGVLPAGTEEGDRGDLGILLSYRLESPFDETLRLTPKVLHLGLGCRRDTPQENIEAAVTQVFSENHLDFGAVKCAASIDLKKDEQGLLAFCEAHKVLISFYTAQELQAVPGSFTPSQFVSSITGVDNVCERSAMVGADNIIVRKTACNGVTVAVAEEYKEVSFG